MKITYIAEFDTKDITKRSGLGVNIAKALEQYDNELYYLDNLPTRVPLTAYLKKVYYKLMDSSFPFDREIWYAEQMSDIVSRKHNPKSDILFSLSSQPIAFVETKKPLVFYTDATFAQMIGFYYKDFSEETIRHGNVVEQNALDNCQLAIYASEWAAQSAINDYGIKEEKIKVVPRGANIECDRTVQDIKRNTNNKAEDKTLKLLLVGIDWYRKGGDLALEIVRYINENFFKAELHVVGIPEIPVKNLPNFVVNHGFLNKSNERQWKKLQDLYLESHFFILPTLADTFGIVFAEANSYGLPAISYDIGGISSVIENDVNGRTFPLGTHHKQFANYIVELFEDKGRYSEMCISAFNEFDTRLNWRVSGGKIQNIIKSL